MAKYFTELGPWYDELMEKQFGNGNNNILDFSPLHKEAGRTGNYRTLNCTASVVYCTGFCPNNIMLYIPDKIT